MKSTIAIVAVAVVAVTSNAQSTQPKGRSIKGVWKVSEVSKSGSITSSIVKPQPSLYIFTDGYYSVMQVTGDKPRPNLPLEGTATASQLLAIYGNSFYAQAGSYEVHGNELTVHPVVAKNPWVMTSSYSGSYEYRLVDNTLTLIEVRTSNGPTSSVTDTTTYRLSRLE